MQRHFMMLCQGIDHVGGRNGLSCPIFPAAALNQIIKQYSNYVVGLDKRAILIHNSETIGIAISGNADASASLFHLLAHFIQEMVFYRALTLGSNNISPNALAIDNRVGYIVTVIGIPSAFLLHGYVGFIFGSVKANPWWSTPLMPVVFLFSAMVSGIAAVMLLYMLLNRLRKQPIDMRCVDTVAKYLFYAFIIDFSLEMLNLIHRIYEADESFHSLDFMVHSRLYISQIVERLISLIDAMD